MSGHFGSGSGRVRIRIRNTAFYKEKREASQTEICHLYLWYGTGTYYLRTHGLHSVLQIVRIKISFSFQPRAGAKLALEKVEKASDLYFAYTAGGGGGGAVLRSRILSSLFEGMKVHYLYCPLPTHNLLSLRYFVHDCRTLSRLSSLRVCCLINYA